MTSSLLSLQLYEAKKKEAEAVKRELTSVKNRLEKMRAGEVRADELTSKYNSMIIRRIYDM